MAERPSREFVRRFNSGIPSEEDLDFVADRAGDNWRSLLTHLGVKLASIQSFLSKNGNITKNACFEGLVYWLKGGVEHSEPATFETLFKALRDAKMAGVVSELEGKKLEERLPIKSADEDKPDQTQKQVNPQQYNRTLQPQTTTKPTKLLAGSTPLQQQASATPLQTNNPKSHNAISPPRERLAERMKIMSTPIPKLSGTEGPQAFQLPTNQLLHDPKRKLAVKAIGTSRRDSSSHKVVMLVGATGAGKTTLINGMVNYIYGVRWEDDFRFKLINDEGNQSQACSQTKWITAYTIYWDPESALKYDLTVINTPGFGDTSGIAADRELVAQIKDFFSITPDQHGIDQIHGIGFVTQASLARLTPPQKYVFDSILSIFGTDVGENILLLTTFADCEKQPVIEAVKAAKVPFRYKCIFKFNNSALFADNRDEYTPFRQGSQNHREDSSDDDNFTEMFWKMGIKSFKTFFKHLDGMEVKSFQLTKEVLKERQQLETILNGIHPTIQAGLRKVATLEQIKCGMEKYEAARIANEKFTFTVETLKMTKKNLEPGECVTNCLECNFTCHLSCSIPNDDGKAGCIAMGEDGNCQVCPGKCYWDRHYNNPYQFECSPVIEVKTNYDLKKKYDDATSAKSRHEAMKANIKREIKVLSKEVLTMLCIVQASVNRLEKIALKPSPLTEVEYLELLIQAEKDQTKKGWMYSVHALEGFLKQAKLQANMRRMGEAQFADAFVDDDMLDEIWFTPCIPVTTAEEIAAQQRGQAQGWTGGFR